MVINAPPNIVLSDSKSGVADEVWDADRCRVCGCLRVLIKTGFAWRRAETL